MLMGVLVLVTAAVWFNCNPFQSAQDDSGRLNVLDTSGRLTIYCTIEVNGTTWDGGGQTIYAVGMGDGSQDEDQDPIFRITNGTVRNVTIGAPACDGLHFMGGNATIESVVVPDVGEDAITVKQPGVYTVNNFTGNNADDKLFQINDLCTITYRNTHGTTMSKMVRQNGDKTWKCIVYIDGAYIYDIGECVWRTDSSTSICYYRNIVSDLPSSSWWYSGATAIAY